MADRQTEHIYINMMVDSLQRKAYILDVLLTLTKEQAELLQKDDLDTDRFESLIEQKGRRIDELNDLDDGFETLYHRFEKELIAHKEDYTGEISRMKELITHITDRTVSIQAQEKRNDDRFQAFVNSRKKQIKDVNVNQRTVQSYVRNMTDVHKSGQSYFLDETK